MAKKGETSDGDGDRFHRRGFFLQGFRNLLKPIADVVEKRLEHLETVEGSSSKGPTGSWDRGTPGATIPGAGASGAVGAYPGGLHADVATVFLRPPGALPEGEFLARCGSCARCVAACPVSAIRPHSHPDPKLNQKPVIVAANQACVVCNDLSCMKVCPTGALQPLDRASIRMGRAVLLRDVCVRSKGEDCQICVDKCPLGTTAIEIPLPGADVSVKDGCTGCGVCEMYCPTTPRAIVVEPRQRLFAG